MCVCLCVCACVRACVCMRARPSENVYEHGVSVCSCACLHGQHKQTPGHSIKKKKKKKKKKMMMMMKKTLHNSLYQDFRRLQNGVCERACAPTRECV